MNSREETRTCVLNEKACIFKPQIRPAKGELVKHYSERGKRFVFLDSRNFPEGNIYMIMRVVRNIRKPYESAELRMHTVDAIMVFIGFKKDLTGLIVEVTLGDKKYVLESPVCIYVRAGTPHTYRILKGSGIYQKIVFAPGGDYNKVTR